jgi:hypothetical protein
MKQLFLIVSCFLVLVSCDNPCPDCGCDNVDDCLSKYKFEEARKYNSAIITFDDENKYGNGRSSEESKPFIIIAEVQYWISQNELEKAVNISKELLPLNKMKEFTELNSSIIKKYCQKQQYDAAKELAKELPEKLTFEEKVYISYGSSQPNETQVQTCRKKYNAIKKGLKSNQEIEPFKESSSDYYKITTYEYPQKEALKIIEEYKKEIQ